MELTAVKNKTILPPTKQYENLPLTFIGKLLATILVDEEEDMLVEGSSQNFVYDAETGVQAGKSLKVSIFEVKAKQQESTIEIRLSGIIKTAKGLRQTCNLYFFMWWDHTQTSPLKNHGIQRLQSLSLLILPENSSERLSDSVFELDLYRRKTFCQQEYMGQGRGYLVFGRTH